MLSLISIHRTQRGSERKGSDIEALASEVSGITMDAMRGSESHGDIQPAPTTENRVTGGLPEQHVVNGLPAALIGVQNGIVLGEERLSHLKKVV